VTPAYLKNADLHDTLFTRLREKSHAKVGSEYHLSETDMVRIEMAGIKGLGQRASYIGQTSVSMERTAFPVGRLDKDEWAKHSEIKSEFTNCLPELNLNL
jgi:hypothetical protein